MINVKKVFSKNFSKAISKSFASTADYMNSTKQFKSMIKKSDKKTFLKACNRDFHKENLYKRCLKLLPEGLHLEFTKRINFEKDICSFSPTDKYPAMDKYISDAFLAMIDKYDLANTASC